MVITPVIMAGGSGSRLWPLSRELYPKQFLSLIRSKSTLFQETLNRLSGLKLSAPIVICNENHRFLAAEQLRQIDVQNATILLEPEGRNTAPAIALAALKGVSTGDDPLLLVLSSDHLIQSPDAFHSSILKALPCAEAGKLVTFGITPSHPATGYGYIEQGSPIGPGFKINNFVEKPELTTARSYLESGSYLWNSGMFMFRASHFLKELKQHCPDILSACRSALLGGAEDMHFTRLDARAFVACPADSIDYAVMEKTTDAIVIPLDAGWSDVGSWSSLWEVSNKDSNDNACKGDVLSIDTTNSYVSSEHRLVATLGIDNLVIVETKDAILVANKNKVEDVKLITQYIKQKNRTEHLLHREIYRPWGMYDSIDTGRRYQVKRITVNPKGKLSVQMHHHRAEHWVVVSGTAKITKGDEVILLTENESIYIPLGVIHSLENPGVIPLEIIEVQSGAYLGEDDIVRLDDHYGRS